MTAKKNTLNTIFLFGAILLVAIATYFIFKPFFVGIFLAFVLSQLFRGWYEKINKFFRGRKSVASLATCLVILFIIIIPAVIVFGILTSEINSLYQNYQKGAINLTFNFGKYSPLFEDYGFRDGKIDVETILSQGNFSGEGAKDVGNLFFEAIKKTYQGASHFFFTLFVTFFVLYYLFKDNKKIIQKLMNLSPLPNRQEKILLENFNSISKATLKGSLVIAIVQGVLLGLLFWFVGISSPAIWGFFAGILSIIPLVGPFFIWLPAGIILLLQGSLWQAIVVFAFGGLVVSSIDNILRPKLVGDDSSMHPLLVFLATLGGIAVFGALGFIIGPVIIALLLSLLKIYEIEFREELKDIN